MSLNFSVAKQNQGAPCTNQLHGNCYELSSTRRNTSQNQKVKNLPFYIRSTLDPKLWQLICAGSVSGMPSICHVTIWAPQDQMWNTQHCWQQQQPLSEKLIWCPNHSCLLYSSGNKCSMGSSTHWVERTKNVVSFTRILLNSQKAKSSWPQLQHGFDTHRVGRFCTWLADWPTARPKPRLKQ